ncbi:MAG: WYL domain-containing protein [Paracoccus aminovorans]|nr:WYL domain-containing protein [Paracoccus aminovorans]
MRPGRDLPDAPMLTRRALARGLAAGTAALGIGAGRSQAAIPPAMDPGLRDAALRGLARAGQRGDPVGAAAAQATAARLAESDPEGALLFRLYRKLDVRPAAHYRPDMPAAAEADLALLHDAIAASTPVAFGYTDLHDNRSERTVLPLALVHPAQGVKLLAFCLQAQDFRQFFVRAMSGLAPQPGDFAAGRMALLTGLAEKEGA